MPYYEYQCTECQHRFEVYRKPTDPPVSRCPECRGQVRKIFRPVGIIFKGSGFHVTDYPNTKELASGKSESKEKEKVGAGSAKEQPGSTKGSED